MNTLADLIKQREALDAQIAKARESERAEAISRVRALVAENGLTAADVFGGGRRERKAGPVRTVAPKYRDPSTGQTWTGRGKAPKWIDGKERSQFAI